MLNLTKVLICSFLFCLPVLALDQSPNSSNPLSISGRLIPYQVESEQIAQLEIDLNLPKEFRAYEDQFKVEILQPEGFKVSQFQMSPTFEMMDKFTKKKKNFVGEKSKLTATVEVPKSLSIGEQTLKVAVTYQACTDTFCLFPKTVESEIYFNIIDRTISTEKPGLFQSTFQDVFKKGLVWTFIFVFIFGFLTSFTPCVYPMIPITLAILGKEAHARTRLQTLAVSLTYVAGIAFTFSSLGVFAASTGLLFGSFMSSPYILGFICLVFFAMALSMLGVFELQAPQFIRDGILSKHLASGYLGAFVSGLLAGVIASPCVGPVLVGVLTFVAQTKDIWLGFWLLFTYALGMGLIFIALGLSTSLTQNLPKSGSWLSRIKYVFAALMMMGSIYYLDQFLIASKIRTQTFLSFDLLKPSENKSSGFKLDLIDWQKYSTEVLEQAKVQKKPVMIDFWASWCAACLEMDEKTFTNQSIQLLSKKFVMIKFDATHDSPLLTELREKYKIVGLPTFIFLDENGQWLDNMTLTEFEDASRFEKRLMQVLEK